MTVAEDIRKEAKKILRYVSVLRRTHEQTVKVMTFNEIVSEPLRADGEPDPSANASEAYREALHFWARRAVTQLTFAEWESMVNDLDDTEQFEGSVISFMENLFSELTTKDGHTIYP